jgi:hypothetical protein
VGLFAASPEAIDTNNDGKPDQWVRVDSEGVTSIETDRDFDGEVEYFLKFDKEGDKIYEELDFNNDGLMDDYYFYKNGALKRREIDSNYDQKIDIWVYIVEGAYIEKYERDTDYDGTVDVVEDYGEEKKEDEAADVVEE